MVHRMSGCFSGSMGVSMGLAQFLPIASKIDDAGTKAA